MTDGEGTGSIRAAAEARWIVEEVAQDVRAHPGEDGVLAEPFASLRLHAMYEAGNIEVVALLLAAAAVGDDEGAAALDADEVEEAQARDPHERLVVEEPRRVRNARALRS